MMNGYASCTRKLVGAIHESPAVLFRVFTSRAVREVSPYGLMYIVRIGFVGGDVLDAPLFRVFTSRANRDSPLRVIAYKVRTRPSPFFRFPSRILRFLKLRLLYACARGTIKMILNP